MLVGDRGRVGKQLEDPLQRVVGAGAAVVHEVERGLPPFLGDAMQRNHPAGVDDGGPEPGLECLVEEHRVEHMAGRHLQPERDIGDSEAGEGSRQLVIDSLDRLQRRHCIAPQRLIAGGEGKGEGVEDQVAGLQVVAADGEVVDSMSDPHLPLEVARLTVLIDEQADHGRSVLLRQAHDPVEAGSGAVTVLEIGGVENRATADPLQAGLHDVGFGGIEHERDADLGGEP